MNVIPINLISQLHQVIPSKLSLIAILSITAGMEKFLELKLRQNPQWKAMYLRFAEKLIKSYLLLQELQKTYMELEKNKCLMKALVAFQFDYCPLIWNFFLLVLIFDNFRCC